MIKFAEHPCNVKGTWYTIHCNCKFGYKIKGTIVKNKFRFGGAALFFAPSHSSRPNLPLTIIFVYKATSFPANNIANTCLVAPQLALAMLALARLVELIQHCNAPFPTTNTNKQQNEKPKISYNGKRS